MHFYSTSAFQIITIIIIIIIIIKVVIQRKILSGRTILRGDWAVKTKIVSSCI